MTLKINLDSNFKLQNTAKLLAFKNIIQNPKTQFFNTFNRRELIDHSKTVYEKFKQKKTFVHVGIGGSSLGPEMLVMALNKSDVQFIFLNNIDPDEIFDQLKNINLTESVFYFVSKSGGTAETLAALSIISNMLFQKGIKEDNLGDYFVFATDPVKSELLDLGKKLNIALLEVPSDVGGRFSVLTPVGYLPAFFANIDVYKLVEGAQHFSQEMLKDSTTNPLLVSAEYIFELYSKQNINQTILMPYSSKLKFLSFWFTQLWAESLGKKLDKNNKAVHVGLTPIPAYGATDQHSQMQLFMEGPHDKLLMLIEVVNFKNDFNLTSKISGPSLAKLKDKTLAQLMKAEFHGTLKALRAEKRNVIHLSIDQNDEFHLGSLIIYFESLTALMGDYLNIDPFNQPGVELGKIYAFEFLSQLK